MLVTLHFDPTCPWTWLTSRWLVAAADREGLELGWAPFSVYHHSGGEEHEEGRAPLRVIQHLLERGETAAIGRYYDAFGALHHRGGREATDALAVEAARDAGLDDDAVSAVGDESLDDAVAKATEAAASAAGPGVGSPILHWVDDGDRDVWIHGPLLDRPLDPACAAEVWRGVRALAVHAQFKDLKRGRSGPPDVRTS